MLWVARKGARAVLVSRNADALDKVAKECAGLGGEALTFAADMADDAAVERMRSFAVSRFGRIDVWVNCAAFRPIRGNAAACVIRTFVVDGAGTEQRL
ncbi:SDR family NAD(P)-dependent oxidoreductase [Mesorhizobium sp. M1088]|uniref:SDR family NAD(P)-dependent oxidoreductase n=1 Tax=Mesorhizobium sp. M1088 TaxID=2957056 RepID=UPI00333554A4